MTTYQAAEQHPPEPQRPAATIRKRAQRYQAQRYRAQGYQAQGYRGANSWRTSTLPAAVSVALLTGLATAIALGFRELVGLAMSVMSG